MPDGDHGPPGPGDFLLWREVDRLDKRIDENLRRIDILDQYGSRGIEGLRAEVKSMREDWSHHELQHQRSSRNLQWAIGLVVVGIVPIYPLILLHH